MSGNNELSVHITNIQADCSSDVLNYELRIATYVKAELGVYDNVNVVFDKCIHLVKRKADEHRKYKRE